MLYDIYRVYDKNDPDVLIETVYQPSEPMYNSTLLLDVIKTRVSQQQKINIDDLIVRAGGQTENIAGATPRI